jgi:methionyl-tRNA formyltransferase
MRIAFFGTPAFAVPSLEALLDLGEQVVMVVTQPDRPKSRSHSTLIPPPVKTRALAAGLPVLQPERPTGEEFLAALRGVEPDLGVVVAYGHILRPAVLGIPRLGMINVHASLLPRWRGAAPVAAAIGHGDRVTGVTIMAMEAGLDSGPIILARETPIGREETGGELTARLATLGAAALTDAVVRHRSGLPPRHPQDPEAATVAPKVGRESARIDWTRPAEAVANLIRAFDPSPGGWTTVGEGDLKLFRPRVVKFGGSPGTVVSLDPLTIAAGSGAVAVLEVQPAGGARMATTDWVRGRGRAIRIGDRCR